MMYSDLCNEEDYKDNCLSYNTRNDNVEGYIYLFRAKDFHGWLPGAWLSRCKIGLSRNPEVRANRIESNQPAHDIEILHTIYVENMRAIEAELHRKFATKNVSLNKSREWFDIYIWDIEWCKFLMNRYSVEKRGMSYKYLAVGTGVIFTLSLIAVIPNIPTFQNIFGELNEQFEEKK